MKVILETTRLWEKRAFERRNGATVTSKEKATGPRLGVKAEVIPTWDDTSDVSQTTHVPNPGAPRAAMTEEGAMETISANFFNSNMLSCLRQSASTTVFPNALLKYNPLGCFSNVNVILKTHGEVIFPSWRRKEKNRKQDCKKKKAKLEH